MPYCPDKWHHLGTQAPSLIFLSLRIPFSSSPLGSNTSTLSPSPNPPKASRLPHRQTCQSSSWCVLQPPDGRIFPLESESERKWKWSRVWLFATPWTVAYQAPMSMGFSRQEYWSGLPFPSPGDLPNPGIEPRSPALQTDALPSEPPGKPTVYRVSKSLTEWKWLSMHTWCSEKNI